MAVPQVGHSIIGSFVVAGRVSVVVMFDGSFKIRVSRLTALYGGPDVTVRTGLVIAPVAVRAHL
jgi:hypothetical protein